MAIVATDLETGDIYTGAALQYDIQDNFGSVLLDGAVVFEIDGVSSYEELEQIFFSEFQVTQV